MTASHHGHPYQDDVVRPPGSPSPLGATWTPEGLNLAVRAPSAELLEACLWIDGEEVRVPLEARSHGVHHGFLRGIEVGTPYGLRAHGPWDPGTGLRFNPAKLLVDPYARAVHGEVRWSDVLKPGTPGDPRTPDPRDSAASMPRSIVVDDAFDWGDDAPPETSWGETVVYEMHVKGYTRQHPLVPEALRGTYAGLAHPAAIDHLVSLGVTAAELLPVHQFVTEPPLAARGVRNYWGYSTLGFFAPHAQYAADSRPGAQVAEFKAMVKALHAAGIEVILDVVYNHTCEGGADGPSLMFRGLGERDHYKLAPHSGTYVDTTGCGNTLDVGDLDVLRMVLDSLRYWVTEMHVDGFRFDLATALTRERMDVDERSPFLAAVHQDPVLRQVKLIAEPWDVGPGGYRVGMFGSPWAEWNDTYRDDVRRFWLRGGDGREAPAEMGWRLTGSQDHFHGRSPAASVNFLTAHDGFTLRDLVSYDRKHNDANGEDNRDGTDNNNSWNHGVEGPTDDVAIQDARQRSMRALLATLLLSTGTPMLVMGDEMGRTQGGNNNAYNQDNEISWLDWTLTEPEADLLRWTTALLNARRVHPTLRQTEFFDGRPVAEGRPADLAWLNADGSPLTDAEWNDRATETLVMALSGELFTRDAEGHPLRDDAFLIVLHRGDSDVDVTLPPTPYGDAYRRLLDTAVARPGTDLPTAKAGTNVTVARRSVALFRVEHD
ncbi:MAG TPA: glycogen debranching protein GlgX [Candidatus Nanopelagicales bacterium]|nr:glycogen debranching protein GlgX [Candidatus Nanopelagicales bacterium]